MKFGQIVPLTEVSAKDLDSCDNLQEFLEKIMVLAEKTTDLRTQQAYLSVYMAFRDHYPSYLEKTDKEILQNLNRMIEEADPKIIKLRRIALAALSKVA
ncbi:hypothetical protein AZI86_01630 [Bdellovibrio bacteriovorus]|uniref:Uncharacterized protein n=1 Tax=Bdellovibrio bacteriovorus TaxID=959 RepID=A0A150WMT3_BDEBC|nr:hypothetical protein [Bdellovibrio bacteriovorus]KYG65801.1 hypothetical protein AZI86_01630 [Bdellovibrio bacteriovorus]